jgi:hypothetical protein
MQQKQQQQQRHLQQTGCSDALECSLHANLNLQQNLHERITTSYAATGPFCGRNSSWPPATLIAASAESKCNIESAGCPHPLPAKQRAAPPG